MHFILEDMEGAATINIADVDGRTPLFACCNHNLRHHLDAHDEIAKLLVLRGSDCAAKTAVGVSCFAMACGSMCRDVIDLIYEKGGAQTMNDLNECGHR